MQAKGYSYYRCANVFIRADRPATCDALSIRMDRLDPTAWDLVVGAIRNPDMSQQ